MSKHEQQDDKDKYLNNGHESHRPPPREDPVASMGSRTRTIKTMRVRT
jgi:hypothetical protein